MQTRETILDACAVVLDVLFGLRAERLARLDDRLVRLSHLLGGEVGVRTGAVPIALDRLRHEVS